MSDEDLNGNGDEAVEPRPPVFKLSLEGEGVSVDRDVTEDMAREIIALVLGGMPGTSAGPRRAARAQGGPVATAKSIREYLDEADAKKNPQIIAAATAYLMDSRNAASVLQSDVKAQFRSAGEPAPANFSRDLRLALGTGWIAEDSAEKGHIFVTQTGRDAIGAKFQGQRIRRPRRRPRREGPEGEDE